MLKAMGKNRMPIWLMVSFILLFVTGRHEASGSSDKFQAEHNTCHISLDFGPGFGSTWFSSRSLNTSLSVIENPASGSSEALRISFLKEENQQRIDHIPIYLEQGSYVVKFHSSCDRPAQQMSVQLIEMKCDSHGKFSNKISSTLKFDGLLNKQHAANFESIPKGVYLLRLSLDSFPIHSKLDLYDFSMYLMGSESKSCVAQVAPDMEDVLYQQGDEIKIGAKIYLKHAGNFDLKYDIRSLDGSLVCEGDLGNFAGPGVFAPSTSFFPQDNDFYVVTYHLLGSQRQIIQKAFSVLPEGDSSFMGLHAYPTNRNKDHLILGRRLGFSHYRDLDMGAFGNWRRIQPGNPKKFNPEKPPPFNWYGDDDIRYLVEKLGYNYLAVLVDTPEWAKDHKRSRPDHPTFVPVLSAWRNYVRNMVQHYSVDMGLIRNWEIWNEGKGISGKRLNDPTIYIELMRIAIEEINQLKPKMSDEPVNIVAFSGFHHQKYWEKVFEQAPGFNAVSSHIKARGYQDTYYPARRKDRDQRKKYCRDAWLQTAKETVQKWGRDDYQMWDTESGMLNQVYPAYDFYDVPGDKARVGMPIADRSAHEWYDPNNKRNYAPLSPLESAAIMVKQIIAHKSCGIDRCYMYYFSNRNFVSSPYAEQMLEYDGTLMPYTHAYVYCSKLLDNMAYESRHFIGDTNIVRERFINDKGRMIDVLWNEGKGLTPLKVDRGVKIYSMMGKELFPNADKHIPVSECPVYFVGCQTTTQPH